MDNKEQIDKLKAKIATIEKDDSNPVMLANLKTKLKILESGKMILK